MAYRQLKPKQQQPVTVAADTDDIEIGYVRISTTAQFFNNTEGLELQLDMAGDAEKLIEGLQPDGSIKGVSGTKGIDERPVLQKAIQRIYEARKQGKRVTFRAISVSRLFRTKSRVPVETFIDICKANDVRIKTKDMTYDFKVYGHDDLFRMQYEFARRYNEQQIDLMHRANAQQAMRGEYYGRQLTPGFIVDRDKESPTYGRYIPYPPHMEVVASLYQRQREVGVERFNELAHEVAQMPFLFPPFEPWVDQRDVNQLRLKKICTLHDKQCDCKLPECELAGYHIGERALRRLLHAVEYAGYWKFHGELLLDASGQPKRNHETGVNFENWEYCFNKLSPVTLTGEPNPNYYNPRVTWTPVKEGRQKPLLAGIITSSLGPVQYSDEAYKVMEMRPGHMARSVTLMVKGCTVDGMFLYRLRDRCFETNLAQGCVDELLRVKERNAKALVSVPEQIKRSEQEIANFQEGLATYLKALGNKADPKTIEKYNEDITNERASLDALVAKTKAAAAEETQLKELSERYQEFIAGGFKENEHTERFIRLACEKVELNEYSAHFATLTITWAAPFHQVDIGYIYLPNGVHEPWSKQEEQDLAKLYPHADRAEILQRFPTRSWEGICSRAYTCRLKRHAYRNTSEVPVNLSLRDCEVLELLGVEPHQTYIYEIMWVKGVLDSGSASGTHL